MTTNTALIAEANDAIGAARDAMNSACTTKARNAAAEDLNWWQGRLAMVSNPKGWA